MTKELETMESGREIAAIIPTNTSEVYRVAEIIFKSGMAPNGMTTVEKCAVAIITGMEVGLNPIRSVNAIAVINGRPTMWGDDVLALVEASDKMEDFSETLEGEGENMKCICTAIRKGRKTPIINEFSVDDAKLAGLWKKKGPWTQYPKRMLKLRARAFTLRDGFSDVLSGIYVREEVQDYQNIRSVPETEAVSVEELTGEPEVKDVDFEEAKIITAEEATDYITRITNAESEEAFLTLRDKTVAEIKDAVDSPLKTAIGAALRTKADELKGSDFPGDDNYKGEKE